jgi:ankyrin repeat protein
MDEEQAASFFKTKSSKSNLFFKLVQSSDVEKIQQLLKDKEVNLETLKDKNGMTPLHVASIMGDVELAKILLENGSKVNVVDKDGFTPFHFAADNDHVEFIEFLYENDKETLFKTSNDAELFLNQSIPLYITGGRVRNNSIF